MFTIRTATRVLCVAAAILAVIGTAQAAEKPKSLVPQGHRVQEELKIKPFKSTTQPHPDGLILQAKPGTAKTFNPKGSGPNGWFEAWPAKLHDKRSGT